MADEITCSSSCIQLYCLLSPRTLWAMAMPMLTHEKIAMGRLCQAYGLTAEEAHTLIQTLWPDKVFPLELWQAPMKHTGALLPGAMQPCTE